MKNIILITLLFLPLISMAQEENPAIQVEVKGKGQPLLLIPGFTVPGESWESIVAQLEESYECHIVTLAGFGGLEPIEFPWLPKVNQALENYIAEQGLNSVTVIGHSLGGTIATWLASRENHRLDRIVLIDALPAAGAMMIPNFNADNLVYDNPYSKQQLAMNDTQFEQMAAGMAQGMSLNQDMHGKIKEWVLIADRKTYVYGYTDYLKLDLREDLKNISVPVSIIAADKPFGKDAVKETYSNQYANLSKYDLIIADNAAHFVMFDQPEWFMEQLDQILSTR